MTILLLKTIHGTSACVSLIQRMLFTDARPMYTYTSETLSSDNDSFLPTMRMEAKIALGLFFFASIVAAIVLTNIVVTREYALSAVSKAIAKEEVLRTEIAAQYAAEQSSRPMQSIADIQHDETFVTVDTVRYLTPSTIVQANATLR